MGWREERAKQKFTENYKPEHPDPLLLKHSHKQPPANDPDGPICGGMVRTIYINVTRRWVRVGKLCMSCLTFYMEPDAWQEATPDEGVDMTDRAVLES